MQKLLFTTAFVLALTAAASSQADHDGIQFFLGGSAGVSSASSGFDGTSGGAKLEEEDNLYKVFMGVQFNDYFALEGHLARIGGFELTGGTSDTYTYKGNTFAFPADNTVLTADIYSIGIAPSIGYDVTDWFRPYAKAGIHYWYVDLAESSDLGSIDAEKDGFDPYLGVGADFNIVSGLNLRTEYEYFVLDDDNVHALSGGAYVKF